MFYSAICDDETMRNHFVNCYSRHREKYSPPLTPEGFWDASFPETQEYTDHRETPAEDGNL